MQTYILRRLLALAPTLFFASLIVFVTVRLIPGNVIDLMLSQNDKVQVCSCSPDHMDLLPLVAGYLEKVGVKLEIQPMEYGAFLSAMTTKTHAPGYFMSNGHTNPTTSIRKSFVTNQTWNPSMWSEPGYDKKMAEVYLTRDESKRQQMIREMTVEILDKAPYVWLPTPYIFTAWWPWVQNYNGELRAGAVRLGPIYARIWIDQEMKKKMGFCAARRDAGNARRARHGLFKRGGQSPTGVRGERHACLLLQIERVA